MLFGNISAETLLAQSIFEDGSLRGVLRISFTKYALTSFMTFFFSVGTTDILLQPEIYAAIIAQLKEVIRNKDLAN